MEKEIKNRKNRDLSSLAFALILSSSLIGITSSVCYYEIKRDEKFEKSKYLPTENREVSEFNWEGESIVETTNTLKSKPFRSKLYHGSPEELWGKYH